jgi:hypothetical protein
MVELLQLSKEPSTRWRDDATAAPAMGDVHPDLIN